MHAVRRITALGRAFGSPMSAVLLFVCLVCHFASSQARDEHHRLSEQQFDDLRTATLVTASLSVAGTGFILVSFLSIANFFSSVSYFFNIQGDFRIDPTPGFACILGAGLGQFFDVASFIWTAIIAFNILQVLVNKKGRAVEQFEKWYHLVGWGIPAVLLIIVASLGGLGDAGNWCWISRDYEVLRIVAYYIPLGTVLLVNMVLYAIIIRSMRETTLTAAVNFRLRLYLLVFVGLRVWSIVNRLQTEIDPNNPVFFLFLLHSLAAPLQGFGNAAVYGFTAKVRSQYRRICCPQGGQEVENPLARTAVTMPVSRETSINGGHYSSAPGTPNSRL